MAETGGGFLEQLKSCILWSWTYLWTLWFLAMLFLVYILRVPLKISDNLTSGKDCDSTAHLQKQVIGRDRMLGQQQQKIMTCHKSQADLSKLWIALLLALFDLQQQQQHQHVEQETHAVSGTARLRWRPGANGFNQDLPGSRVTKCFGNGAFILLSFFLCPFLHLKINKLSTSQDNTGLEEQEKEKRRLVIEKFQKAPFEEIAAQCETKANLLHDRLAQILELTIRPPPSPSGTLTITSGCPHYQSVPVYEMKFPDLCVY
ncbi:PREDICTED: uncharacterized protein LOC106540429 [Thamnophis sirtalis]|uniref:Uncharacterized protein LOC106540429 n=1 Tax=Thamnophis sirtalis TaxID=35019 RepID=A0A6I9XB05_9SAUR|nr:PREDICTED: uncharacterized protein LOC106540429 [Thamnophis sirtalis]